MPAAGEVRQAASRPAARGLPGVVVPRGLPGVVVPRGLPGAALPSRPGGGGAGPDPQRGTNAARSSLLLWVFRETFPGWPRSFMLPAARCEEESKPERSHPDAAGD